MFHGFKQPISIHFHDKWPKFACFAFFAYEMRWGCVCYIYFGRGSSVWQGPTNQHTKCVINLKVFHFLYHSGIPLLIFYHRIHTPRSKPRWRVEVFGGLFFCVTGSINIFEPWASRARERESQADGWKQEKKEKKTRMPEIRKKVKPSAEDAFKIFLQKSIGISAVKNEGQKKNWKWGCSKLEAKVKALR